MVQLKSFKYFDSSQNDQAAPEPRAPSLPVVPSADHEVEREVVPEPARSSSSSSASTSAGSSPTRANVGGGNLTSETSSQKSDKSDADQAECQSAKIELDEEEEEGETEIDSNPHKQQHQQQAGAAVTKIEIEHRQAADESRPRPFKPTAMSRAKQELSLLQQPAAAQKGPQTPQLRKLCLTRSQTSPSPISHMALGRSPKLVRGLGQTPPLFASPSLGRGRASSPGDNTSQLSYAMQQRNNQFEIRWQCVRLFARPKSRVPSWVSDNSLYRSIFGSASELDQETVPAQSCYSPPVQHKIPATINELPDETRGLGEPQAALDGRPHTKQRAPTPIAIATHQSSLPASQSLGKLHSASQAAESEARARCILDGVSGQVFSGQMTAILGPSGVGKTTLLNSLTGRNTLDGTGRVQLIGANDSKRMSVVTVPQVDVLPGKLTTLEDLRFTSRLRNPQARFDHSRNIERVVKCLHMEKFLHTRIDKLSGGEARRLSIGRELLNCPDIMILDEPTSGLDANTCKKIISALRDIVEHSDNILDKPMSIIITIHQPQREVYNIFHRVYVMAQGGRVIYEGPPNMLMPTFIEQSSLNRTTPLDQLNENPAIVAIEVASGEFGPQIIDELADYHELQVYEEFSFYSGGASSVLNGPGGGIGSTESPLTTPRGARQAHKSPLSVSRFDMSLHRKRLSSLDGSTGRPTPVLAKRGQMSPSQLERMSSMTSLSYASTYDNELPECNSKLKVDKRLRRSVVIKSSFWSHTATLIERCWLLTKRDMFLMAIRVIGFLLVSVGTVQIFAHALDPEEHQCPQFESEVDDMYSYLGQVKARLIGLLDVLRQANSTHLFFFHVLLCITMVTSALTGLIFPLQMRMFVREYKNGWYSPASFIMSQTIAELPADILGPLITVLITYPLCHQPESPYHWREIGYALVMIGCAIICKAQAQIAGAFLMDSVENSVFISCVLVTVPALLSGIPLRIEQMIAPLRWVSYSSFLRYGFESLLALRYGYGMCPCDPNLVNGYPLVASAQAIPPHLENLATGLLELSGPSSNLLNGTSNIDQTGLVTTIGPDGTTANDNLFLRFIRLITDASNMFTQGSELADCNHYRSLYLIQMSIPKDVLNKWIPVMLFMFVISRIITYFAVKTVIKLRRN